MFKTGDTFGQRIRWSSKDFLDISYAIMNSTGHQIVLRDDSESLIEDICIALALKMLVRWSSEPLPWKQKERVPMMECQKFLSAKYGNTGTKITDYSGRDVVGHMRYLPQFLEQQELMLFTDVEEFLAEDDTDAATVMSTSNNDINLIRAPSQLSCESARRPKRRSRRRGELNIEDQDDDDDVDVDTNTQSSRYRYEVGSGDDLTTSGFIDDRSEYTGGWISWTESV